MLFELEGESQVFVTTENQMRVSKLETKRKVKLNVKRFQLSAKRLY